MSKKTEYGTWKIVFMSDEILEENVVHLEVGENKTPEEIRQFLLSKDIALTIGKTYEVLEERQSKGKGKLFGSFCFYYKLIDDNGNERFVSSSFFVTKYGHPYSGDKDSIEENFELKRHTIDDWLQLYGTVDEFNLHNCICVKEKK